MKILGLCGGSGSGKGVVSSFFNDLGIKSIDTDKVYHSIISENGACTEELVEAFGIKQAPTLIVIKGGEAQKYVGVSDIKKMLNA